MKSLYRSANHCVVTLSSQSPVEVLSIRSINSIAVSCAEYTASKGTVFLNDFSTCSDAEIKNELPPGTSFLRRLPFRGGSLDSSARILLEFNTMQPPQCVNLLCGLRLDVRTHIPAPLRCRTCLVYGHHERSCDKAQHCGNCGGTDHVEAKCTASPHCHACGGPHGISSTSCPEWQKEHTVNKIRFLQSTSTTEARKLASTSRPHPPDLPTTSTASPNPNNAPSWASITTGLPATKVSQQHLQDADSTQLIALIRNQTKILENQLSIIVELKKQNDDILSLLSGLTNETAQEQPSSRRILRPRKTAVATPVPAPTSSSAGQRKDSQPVIQSQPLTTPQILQSMAEMRRESDRLLGELRAASSK